MKILAGDSGSEEDPGDGGWTQTLEDAQGPQPVMHTTGNRRTNQQNFVPDLPAGWASQDLVKVALWGSGRMNV